MLVEYASHHIQHMQKALTQMNVKLQHVISDITGKTRMAIIGAIVRSERDPRKLAQLRDPRTRADQATIAKSLQGHWREEHLFELTPALELYRVYHAKIVECDLQRGPWRTRLEARRPRPPPPRITQQRTENMEVLKAVAQPGQRIHQHHIEGPFALLCCGQETPQGRPVNHVSGVTLIDVPVQDQASGLDNALLDRRILESHGATRIIAPVTGPDVADNDPPFCPIGNHFGISFMSIGIW